jgi:cytochrome c553
MTRTMTVAVIVLAGGGWLAGARHASATVDMQKKAKAAGVGVQSCLHCHGEKLPKKGASTLNDRGKWLMTEKDKRKAKEVDAAWLKDYVEKK